MTRTVTTTAIQCSSCMGETDEGFYYLMPWGWECTSCGHNVSLDDIDLDEGETLATTTDGLLAYSTTDDDADPEWDAYLAATS